MKVLVVKTVYFLALLLRIPIKRFGLRYSHMLYSGYFLLESLWAIGIKNDILITLQYVCLS